MIEKEKVYFRPHMANAFAACPSSAYKDADLIVKREPGNPAAIGSAVHDLMRGVMWEREPNYNDYVRVAEKFNCPVDGFDGVERKAKATYKFFCSLIDKGYFKAPIREKSFPCELSNGYDYTFRPDMFEIHKNFGVVMDLKTSVNVEDWKATLLVYCLSLFKNFPNIKKWYGIVMAPIPGYQEIWSWSSEKLLSAEEHICKKMERVNKEFIINSKCKFCPRISTCPALHLDLNLIQNDLEKGLSVSNLNKSFISQNRDKVQALKALIDNFDSAEKQLLEFSGDIILEDGMVLTQKEEVRKSFYLNKTRDLIRNEFGVEIEKEQMFGKVDIGEAVRKKLGKGTKGIASLIKEIEKRILSIDGAFEEKRFMKRKILPKDMING